MSDHLSLENVDNIILSVTTFLKENPCKKHQTSNCILKFLEDNTSDSGVNLTDICKEINRCKNVATKDNMDQLVTHLFINSNPRAASIDDDGKVTKIGRAHV